ncbi:MAG: hypothetical protein WDM77_03725 [Steroidobacteraceae bacterium]
MIQILGAKDEWEKFVRRDHPGQSSSLDARLPCISGEWGIADSHRADQHSVFARLESPFVWRSNDAHHAHVVSENDGLVMVEHITWQVEGKPVLSIEMVNPVEQRKPLVPPFLVGGFSAGPYSNDGLPIQTTRRSKQ